MFVRVFIQANNQEEAQVSLLSILAHAQKVEAFLEVIGIEQYWKIEDYFQVELKGSTFTENQLYLFLDSLATRWTTYPNSFLATNTMEDCIILIEHVKFIEVFYQ